jgi:hypothetical protein
MARRHRDWNVGLAEDLRDPSGVRPGISTRSYRRGGSASGRAWQSCSSDGREGVRGQGGHGESESVANPQPAPQSHAGDTESASQAVSAEAKPRADLGATEAPSSGVDEEYEVHRRDRSPIAFRERNHSDHRASFVCGLFLEQQQRSATAQHDHFQKRETSDEPNPVSLPRGALVTRLRMFHRERANLDRMRVAEIPRALRRKG